MFQNLDEIDNIIGKYDLLKQIPEEIVKNSNRPFLQGLPYSTYR